MNWWKKISNLGITEDANSAEKRRAQLANRLIFISIWMALAYIPIFISEQLYGVVIHVVVGMVFTTSLLFISKSGHHSLAAIMLNLLQITNVTLSCVLIPVGETQLYLLPLSMLGFAMVKSKNAGVGIFLYAFLSFFLIRYIQVRIEPLIEFPQEMGTTLYLFNIVFVFFGSGYTIYHFKLTNEDYEKDLLSQKGRIEKQNTQLEETLKEITDSIIYAKRIQTAILPSLHTVKEHLKESFVLYKPKDVVAGDFYWMEPKGDKLLFAVGDCTGHGVPGAIVSVICNNALNRSTREYNLTDPGKILDKAKEIVIQEFEKSEEEVQDGMDIALCSLEGNKLHYAGANNPLWIIRNNELIEIKSDKQPIGKFDNLLPYTSHTFELEKGDTFYIFSDGYVDQFGGEKGKKYKSGNFKKFLISIQKHSLEKQCELLENEFEIWKGQIEQIDDVCIIGVRI